MKQNHFMETRKKERHSDTTIIRASGALHNKLTSSNYIHMTSVLFLVGTRRRELSVHAVFIITVNKKHIFLSPPQHIFLACYMFEFHRKTSRLNFHIKLVSETLQNCISKYTKCLIIIINFCM